MVNHTSLAVHFYRSVALSRQTSAILNVQMLQSAAVIRNVIQSVVAYHAAIAKAELLQGTTLSQHLQSGITNVATANIYSAQSGTTPRNKNNGIVTDRLAAPRIQISKLVAAPGDHLKALVRYFVALGHGQVAQLAQLGQLIQSKVGDFNAIRDAEFTQRRAIGSDAFQAGVWK